MGSTCLFFFLMSSSLRSRYSLMARCMRKQVILPDFGCLEKKRRIHRVAILKFPIRWCSWISFRSKVRGLSNHIRFYCLNLSGSHFQSRMLHIPQPALAIWNVKNTTYVKHRYTFEFTMSLDKPRPVSKKRLFDSSSGKLGDRRLWVRNLHLT